MRKRQNTLDALKVICCIVICFFYHYSWLLTDGYGLPFPFTEAAWPLFRRGYYCVETFFVISGFTMAYTYKERCKLQLEKGKITLARFLWGRMRNVYSLLVLTLLITTGLQFVHKAITGGWFYVENVTVYNFLMSLLNVSSGWFIIDNNLNMPVWYFSTLMLCYILYYCILKISKKDQDLYQILCVLLVVIGIRAFIVPVWKPFLYENTARGYYCFFLGVLLYDIYIYIQKKHRKNETFRPILCC